MESTHEKIILSLLTLFLLLSCSNKQTNNSTTILFDKDKPIRNGDIVLRLGNGFFSSKFKEYASTSKTFSHVGIICISAQDTCVIHVEASELTGVGHVKKEDIHSFLNEIELWSIYRLPSSDTIVDKAVKNATAYFDHQIPFDLNFDSFDNSELYCTELIALSINQAFGDTIFIHPTLQLGTKVLYSLDDIYIHTKAVQIY